MRALLLVMLLGCNPFEVPKHPAVIPKLSEVPADKRDDMIQSSLVRPAPEQQPKTAKGRREETVAAFMAATIADMFSKDSNVTFGLEWMDVDPDKKKRPDVQPAEDDPDHKGKPKPPVDDPAAATPLVPWVRLK